MPHVQLSVGQTETDLTCPRGRSPMPSVSTSQTFPFTLTTLLQSALRPPALKVKAFNCYSVNEMHSLTDPRWPLE